MRPIVWMIAAALVGCGESEGPSDFERSCGGDRVLECDPYEYTVITAATIEPARIRPLDPDARATVRVELDACEMRPRAAEVQLFARLAPPDAGSGNVRLVDLGLTVRDDGTNGDAVANDGVIEQTIGNPFGREIPGSQAITLRLVPVLAGCQGDALELRYETGARFVP